MKTDDVDMESEIELLLGAMTLDEKTSLTAGANMWYLPPVERLGIPALKVSDGPSGVRGDSLIGRRSLSVPCGTAVGSTWNPDLVRRLGDVLAAEARSKNVHVLLGPTVCIVRTPLAGRTFESFSEDPLLTARIAGAYVEGVQAGGVACCVKHFACNDQEHERMTISAEVDERTLREIHLIAFEHAVQEAGVWSVMTAYNKVNGVYCGEQPDLIDGVLRGEWACPTGSGRTRPWRRRWRGSTSRCRARRPGSVPPWPPPCATGGWTSRWSTARSATSCAYWAGWGSSAGRPSPMSSRSTIRGVGRWPDGWRRRAPSCWSTTACCPWMWRGSPPWP
jgi:hypothetical protein